MTTPAGSITCKARLVMFSADLPARAGILNMKQYNGRHGCIQCEDEGVPRPASHLQRNWPYSTATILRTHESVVFHAREAVRTREPVSFHQHYAHACKLCFHSLYPSLTKSTLTLCRARGSKELQFCAGTDHLTWSTVL